MQPRDTNIQNLCLYNPRLAYGYVMGYRRVPFVGGFPFEFVSGAVDATPLELSLSPTNLTTDVYVEKIAFSLWQPNSFVGSPFQAQAFAQLKQCPGVGVQMAVYGCEKYDVNDGFTEIANLADILAIGWPGGWRLKKQSNVKCKAILTQAPASVPFDVSITLLGWSWVGCQVDDMSDLDIRTCLRNLGFTVPDLTKCAG